MTICKTKRWGASLGVVIPKAVVDEMHLSENQEIVIEIQPKTDVLKEMFGFAKKMGLKKSTEQIIKETRAEMGVD